MAQKFLTPIDHSKLESLNFRFQNLSTAPATPATGQAYYDTDTDTLWYYSAGASDWVELSTGTGLTQEQVEDFVGAMVTGNVETGIAVTYDDTGGKLDFAVSDEYIQDLIGAMFSGNTETRITATYDDTNGKIDLVVDALSTEDVQDIVGAMVVAGNNIDVTYNDGAGTLTIDVESLTSADLTDFAEAVSDQVGTMVTGNTETGITVSYDDADNTLDFVVGALNTLPAPTGDLSLNSNKITNLTDGSAATDAATVGQLSAVSAGFNVKDSVRVATAAAGTLASSFENGDTVDGVTLATGDRILIKDQAAGAENGIYIVAASGAPTRATDADTSADIRAAYVWVEEGTTNADTAWFLTTDSVTLGTTALTFTQVSGLGQVTAGDALTKTGNTLNVAPGTGLEISSDTIRIAATAAGSGLTGGGGSALDVNVGSGLEISSDAVRIAAAAAGNGLTGGAGSALAVGAGTGITVNADDVALDTAVAVRKYVGAITGGATSEVVTHNLGTRDVRVTLRNNASPYEEVIVDNEATSTNTVTLRSAGNLPASYRVIVHG